MSIFIFLVFLFFMIKKKSRDERKGDLFKFIVASIFLCAIFGTSFWALYPFAFLIFITYLVKRGGQEKREQQREQDYQSSAFQGRASYENQSGGYYELILPKLLRKRKRIIEKFSDEFSLNLTKEQIGCIAEASYISDGWKKEVHSMDQVYQVPGQWFTGKTAWLRVYLYAFRVQNITSDFAMQEQIASESLDEVVSYACSLPASTIEERVAKVNNQYMTQFNEMTFMIALRYLQEKGKNYTMQQPDLSKNMDHDLDEALKKYSRTPQE